MCKCAGKMPFPEIPVGNGIYWQLRCKPRAPRNDNCITMNASIQKQANIEPTNSYHPTRVERLVCFVSKTFPTTPLSQIPSRNPEHWRPIKCSWLEPIPLWICLSSLCVWLILYCMVRAHSLPIVIMMEIMMHFPAALLNPRNTTSNDTLNGARVGCPRLDSFSYSMQS